MGCNTCRPPGGGEEGGAARSRIRRYLLLVGQPRRPQSWKFCEKKKRRKKEHPSPGEEGGERGECPGVARWEGKRGGDSPKKAKGHSRRLELEAAPKNKNIWEALAAPCLGFPPGAALRGARSASGRALGWKNGGKLGKTTRISQLAVLVRPGWSVWDGKRLENGLGKTENGWEKAGKGWGKAGKRPGEGWKADPDFRTCDSSPPSQIIP